MATDSVTEVAPSTPLPWRVQGPTADNPQMPVSIYGVDTVPRSACPSRGLAANEIEVAVCYGYDHKRAEQNAAFIVHAVNCHAELLAALRLVSAWFGLGAGRDIGALEEAAIRSAIQQLSGFIGLSPAVAKAEEGR